MICSFNIIYSFQFYFIAALLIYLNAISVVFPIIQLLFAGFLFIILPISLINLFIYFASTQCVSSIRSVYTFHVPLK